MHEDQEMKADVVVCVTDEVTFGQLVELLVVWVDLPWRGRGEQI